MAPKIVKEGNGFRRSEVTKKRKSDVHLVLSLGSGSIVSHLSSRWFCSCLGNRGGSTSKIYGNFINAFLFMLRVFLTKIIMLGQFDTFYDGRRELN